MAVLNPLGRVFRLGDDGLKKKLGSAIKQIEVYGRVVENIRMRLEGRRQALFEQILSSIEKKDEGRAKVCKGELIEIKKVIRVVTVSELALDQMVLRLESIRDVGDVYANMSRASKLIRGVSKSISGVMPALESSAEEVNSALSETLLGLGNISPSISFDVRQEGVDEMLEKAKRFAEAKALELEEYMPALLLSADGETLLEKAENVALCGGRAEADDVRLTSLTLKSRSGLEDQVSEYIKMHGGRLDLQEAATLLNIPADEVEQAVFKLVSEEKLRLESSGR